MESVAGQFSELLLALICGVFLGFFYDIYRLLRHFVALHRHVWAFLDILWWAFAFVIVFAVWLWFTWGEVRFSFLVWQALGFVLYNMSLSRHIYGLGKWFLSGQARAEKKSVRRKFFRRVYEVVTWPFYALAFFIHRLAVLLLRLFRFLSLFARYLVSLFLPPRE